MNRRLLAALPFAALLALAAPSASAQAFRCQFQDGHVEFRDGTCPYGTKALNVSRPGLKQAATPAPAASAAPASAPAAASAALPTAFDAPGADGTPPVTWGLVDIDYPAVSVRTLFGAFAKLVNRQLVVDPSVRERALPAHYHGVPWDEAVADAAARAGVDVRDDGKTLTVKNKTKR